MKRWNPFLTCSSRLTAPSAAPSRTTRASARNAQQSCPGLRGRTGLRQGAGYGRCAFAVYYEGDVRESLLRFKFGGRASWANVYARELAGARRGGAPVRGLRLPDLGTGKPAETAPPGL